MMFIFRYGELLINVVIKKQLMNTEPKPMKLSKFLKGFTYEDWYLSNYVPVEMLHELGVSDYKLYLYSYFFNDNSASY